MHEEGKPTTPPDKRQAGPKQKSVEQMPKGDSKHSLLI
jgi:hypothetical protein